MRGPDFRFGAHETRAEQPPDDHPCPREIECSWGFARGFRAAPCRDAPAETERRRTWGSNGCGHLSWDLIGSTELSAQQRAHRANWIPRARSETHRPQTRHLQGGATWSALLRAMREKEQTSYARGTVHCSAFCFLLPAWRCRVERPKRLPG